MVQTRLRCLFLFLPADWPFVWPFSCAWHDVALCPPSFGPPLVRLHLKKKKLYLVLENGGKKKLRWAATLSDGRRSRDGMASRWVMAIEKNIIRHKLIQKKCEHDIPLAFTILYSSYENVRD